MLGNVINSGGIKIQAEEMEKLLRPFIPVSFVITSVPDQRLGPVSYTHLALNGGKPAAVCCTSGTALLNLHPAVAEAFYQNVPLVVISACLLYTSRCV